MTSFKTWLMSAAALASLGACATTANEPPASAAAAQPAAPAKSVLDAAIEAAGGEAALAKVKELYWTGDVTLTVDGKATKHHVQTVIRADLQWARNSIWDAGKEPKTARTLQVEHDKAWDVARQSWTPLPEPQAINEAQRYGLYTLMLLAPLKGAEAKVREQPPGADGTRAIQASLPGHRAAELEFDASGKLLRAGMVVRDPKGGADIVQTIKFSGEVVSNGVKWPKRITIDQNGAPFYEIDITKFEAAAAHTPRPMEQSMQYEGGQNNAGEENAG